MIQTHKKIDEKHKKSSQNLTAFFVELLVLYKEILPIFVICPFTTTTSATVFNNNPEVGSGVNVTV